MEKEKYTVCPFCGGPLPCPYCLPPSAYREKKVKAKGRKVKSRKPKRKIKKEK